MAKRSAAFEMCISLLKKGFIDGHLLSVYKKQLPAFRNAQLALSSKKSNMYPMRLKPSLWSEGRGTVPTQLYLTILDVSAGLDRPHRPIGLLTRRPLPDFPQFPLFLDSGNVTMVITTSIENDLAVTEAVLDHLTTFTLRLWKDVNAKIFAFDVAAMSYWVTPIMVAETPDKGSSPNTLIDWALLKTVFENEEYPWTPEMPDSFLADKFLVDRWAGGQRWICHGVNPVYKPFDPIPSNTVKPGGPGGKNRFDILSYSISMFPNSVKGKRLKAECNLNQPVVETDQIMHRQNWLDKLEVVNGERITKAFLCPQPLKISAVCVFHFV
jgi:endoribonuclease Dicer